MANKGFGYDFLSQKGTSLADPTSPTDAANKQYVDNMVAGLAWKQPVRAASTASGTLATAYANGGTLDGVSLTTGMRILLKDQATGAENGIYTVNASGAPTRATDADSTAELNNATVYVVAGTVNADRAYTQTANDPTLGSTALTWAQVGGGTTYSAGNGLSLASTTFSVNADGTSIIADGTNTRVNPAYSGLSKRYSADLGTVTSGTTITVTHNLGTTDIAAIFVKRLSDNAEVETNFVPATSNTVTGTLPINITTGDYRITILA